MKSFGLFVLERIPCIYICGKERSEVKRTQEGRAQTLEEYLSDVQLIAAEDELASLWTSTIFKIRQGLIWAGTKYGLNRYNG